MISLPISSTSEWQSEEGSLTNSPVKPCKFWNDKAGSLTEMDDISGVEDNCNLEDEESQDSKVELAKVMSSATLRYSELKEEEKSTLLAESIPKEKKVCQDQFQRMTFSGNQTNLEDQRENCRELRWALEIRKKWKFKPRVVEFDDEMELTPHDKPILLNPERVTLPGKSNWEMEMLDGVYSVSQKQPGGGKKVAVMSFWKLEEFLEDLQKIMKISNNGSTRTFCWKRLKLLETRFEMHNMLNDRLERKESRNCPHRDFYNVRKVDNNVSHSACMNKKHLLRFIKSRIKQCPHAVVMEEDGELITLKQLVENLDVKPHELSTDTLDMTPGHVTFHRFDRFAARYNPLGMSKLRSIFLETDNQMNGRFLAEITEEVFEDFESSKYQNAELSLYIRGMSSNEWDSLARWVCQKNLQANHIKWMIQTPRIYPVLKKAKMVCSFKEMIDNIFRPLFEATIDPSSHPELHLFLKLVVGFDCVGNDSIPDKKRKSYPKPSVWTTEDNPPFILYTYYLYGNLYVLNKLREERGMNTFMWRPHAGVSGDIEHLGVSFMVSDCISHGIALKRFTVLQYLYYLSQIGIAMSPLSNNLLFLEYQKNPFPLFFTRGLRVTLCTEDPLMVHYTKEPLVEEYAIAAQLYKLSNIDMCEIARNSVLISGFSHTTKGHWIGRKYNKRGPRGNCIDKTNVPNIRVLFRQEMLQEEEDMLRRLSSMEPIYQVPSDIRKKVMSKTQFGPGSIHGTSLEGKSMIKPERSSLLQDQPCQGNMNQQQIQAPKDRSSWLDDLHSNLRSCGPTIAFGVIAGVILMRMQKSTPSSITKPE